MGAALTVPRVQRHAPRGGVRVGQVQTQPPFSRARRIRYSGGRDGDLRVRLLPTGKGQPGTTVRSLNIHTGAQQVVSWTRNVSCMGALAAKRGRLPGSGPSDRRTELTRGLTVNCSAKRCGRAST